MLTFLSLMPLAWGQSTWTPGDTPAEPVVIEETVEAPPLPSPWKESRHTLIGGIELIVVGSVVGIGTHRFAANNNADVAEGSAMLLQIANVGGWTMAGSGVALATVGALHGTGVINRKRRMQVAATPGGMTVAGRF